jgi:serine/threonine protein kinase
MLQLAKAVEYLHSLRPVMVMHRDVKTANIMLTSAHPNNADIKLGDLGLHKQVL